KKRYDGYHFCRNTEGIYNPFSLLNTFDKKEFKDYWFETGTPTFLVKTLEKIDFDIKTMEDDVKIPARSLVDYRGELEDPIPLLYQSGYLTIKSYNDHYNSYTLGFPNEEVKYGFLNELLPLYVPKKNIQSEFYVEYFIEDLLANNVDGFMNRLKAFFAGISYELDNKKEKHYQTVFYLLFKLMGQFIEVEHRSAVGRADAVVTTNNTVFVFEFKLTENATAEEALKQIDDKNYLIPFTAGNKKLVKVGVEFSKEERGINRWIQE
ncbi:MAG: ATP-binding protein, partial [Bacteroidales bacterium]|nr:ATP-binding protein [Bacteroidales bacterium]